MYDPEISLKRQSDLVNDEILLEKVVARLGCEDPWSQRVILCTDIFKTLSQKEEDLDNCFDPDVKTKIEKEIEELISIAKKAL